MMTLLFVPFIFVVTWAFIVLCLYSFNWREAADMELGTRLRAPVRERIIDHPRLRLIKGGLV